jgi:atypical dual specificity phosphatase
MKVPSRLSRLYARSVFYPTLGWNYLLARVLRKRRWWDRIDPLVIVGAFPFRRDVEELHDAGVRAVVNTCEEYAGPVAQYERIGIQQLHIPTTDFTHPRLQDVQKAVEFVERHVAAGDAVYIHCKAGRARSATVAICWLMKYRGLTMDEAQQRLLEKRPHINPRLTERPVVRQFAESIQQQNSNST